MHKLASRVENDVEEDVQPAFVAAVLLVECHASLNARMFTISKRYRAHIHSESCQQKGKCTNNETRYTQPPTKKQKQTSEETTSSKPEEWEMREFTPKRAYYTTPIYDPNFPLPTLFNAHQSYH